MNDLYIIQNLNILLEEVLVKKPLPGDFYTLNPHYVKIDSVRGYLRKKTEQFYPALTFLPYQEISGMEWGTVYIASNVTESYREEIENLKAQEIILVEDGNFDYGNDEKEYPFYRGKKLYLYDAANAGNRARTAHVLPIVRDAEIEERFTGLFQEELEPIRSLSSAAPVLFTAPLMEDLKAEPSDLEKVIRYLEKRLGPCTMVLKKHPRDSFQYQSDIINFIDVGQNIPGQILDRLMMGDKYFLSASTVGASGAPGSRYYAIMVLPDNERYRKDIENFETMQHFLDKKVTILVPSEE